PYVGRVHGYDISEKLCAAAYKKSVDNHIGNIEYKGGGEYSVENIELKCVYDHIMLMGVLSYVLDDREIERILEKIYFHLKDGGYLVYKDNLNNSEEHYYFGKGLDYRMVARTEDFMMKEFLKAGFSLIDKKNIHERLQPIQRDIQVKDYSLMCIFQKGNNK
ncbi:methyltransferase, partial [Helicobacter pullorum]|uniref:methyltransferase n=2 Tax=Helicobacter pullorum TaxID=35818 RepID=UPI001181B5C9